MVSFFPSTLITNLSFSIECLTSGKSSMLITSFSSLPFTPPSISSAFFPPNIHGMNSLTLADFKLPKPYQSLAKFLNNSQLVLYFQLY